MVAVPTAFASDFVTGAMVDSGSKKVEDTGPERKMIIDYHDGQPVVTKVEAFKSNKWRKLYGPQSDYYICPGEYRSYLGKLRCRVHDDGFSGFMGGMTDAQELPLQEALTKLEGKPISLQTIEVHGKNLAVKYQLAPPAQTHVKTQDLGMVKQDGETQNSGGSFPLFLVVILPVLIFLAYLAYRKSMNNQSDSRESMNNQSNSEIDELLREARRAERAERQNNEPPSMDELRERQQENTGREPVVVSSSALAPKEEPVKVQPGKRKIILD